MNREPILFDEDLIREYAQKREGLEERDVKDLLKCLIGYLKQRVKKGDTYVIDLGYIGVLYEGISEDSYNYEAKGFKNKNDEKRLVESAILGAMSQTNKEPLFNNNERRELQNHTNFKED